MESGGATVWGGWKRSRIEEGFYNVVTDERGLKREKKRWIDLGIWDEQFRFKLLQRASNNCNFETVRQYVFPQI